MTRSDGELVHILCPVCGIEKAMREVFRVAPAEGDAVHYLCPECEAWVCHPFEHPDYASTQETPGFSLYRPEFYAELGCGLAFVTQPMHAVLSSGVLGPRPRVLEVGGGLGFALHFARLVHGVEGVGFEPGPLATLGAEALKVDNRHAYLETPFDPPVDLVQAIEVLEHVEDPRGFLDLLLRSLAPGGIGVLSTPDRAVLDQHPPSGTSGSDQDGMAIVSPGQHRTLFDRASLEKLFLRAGLRRFRITSSGKSLVCLFTRSESIDLESFELDPQHADLGPYLRAALEDLAARPGAPLASHVRKGLHYLAFKEAFHQDDHDAANEAFLAWCEDFGGPGGFLDALNDFDRLHPLEALDPLSHFQALAGFTYTAYGVVFFLGTMACVAPEACMVPLEYLLPACVLVLRRLTHLLQVPERRDPPRPRSVLQSYLLEYEAYYLRFRYQLAILLEKVGHQEAALTVIQELLEEIQLTSGRLFCDARLEGETETLRQPSAR